MKDTRRTNRWHAGKNQSGFTLTEMLTTVVILGGLSSIAIPTYLDHRTASCQSYPKSIISQAMSQAQAFNDEYATAAESWSDLDKIATIMTKTGPASGGDLSWIELPNCKYKLMGERKGNEYTFIATQSGAFIPPEEQEDNNEIDSTKNKYNIAGCINIATGASDIRSGNGKTAVSTSSLSCG